MDLNIPPDGPARLVLSGEDLERLVRRHVEASRGARRECASRAAIDAAAEAAVGEGRIHLASCLLMISAHAVLGMEHEACRLLMQSAFDPTAAGPCAGGPAGRSPAPAPLEAVRAADHS